MQRVQRRLAILGLALAATLTLTACQNDATQAISMGDYQLSNSDVENTADVVEPNVKKLIDDLKAQGQPIADSPIRGDLRNNIVQLSAFNEVARRYTQEKRISVGAPDYSASAENVGLPENDPLTRLFAQAEVYREALQGAVAPATPTDADLNALYAEYVKTAEQAGQEPSITADVLRNELANDPTYRTNLGIRNELMAAMDRYGLVVNPRYAPLTYALQSAQTDVGRLDLVAIPLGEQGTGAVRDVG